MIVEMPRSLIAPCEAFAPLTASERTALKGIQSLKSDYPKNQLVFLEGDPAEHLFLVEKGVCFTYRYLEDGARQIIELFLAGELVGLDELASDRHSHGLATMVATTVAAYRKDDVLDVFSRSATLSRFLIDRISQAQARMEQQLVGFARYCARQRVAHFLLELRCRIARAKGLKPGPTSTAGHDESYVFPGTIRIPQVVIADVVGLSVVHVNRVLRQLREEGLIGACHHGIELRDVDALRQVADWRQPTLSGPLEARAAELDNLSSK